MSTVSLLGILAALVVLTLLVMKGVDLFVSVFVCTMIVCLTSALNPYETLKTTYMPSFVSFMQNYFLVFICGAMMGKVMEISGGAIAIGRLITKLSSKYAYALLPVVGGIMTYGGVYCFVACFALLPIANAVFREANLPRRFVPASIFFGCATFAMVAPGTPQIQNVIPTTGMEVPYTAGFTVGMVSCGFVMVAGTIWLKKMIDKAVAAGEHWEDRESDVKIDESRQYPNGVFTLIPLVATVVCINLRVGGQNVFPLEVAMLIGFCLMLVVLFKHIRFAALPNTIGESVKSALGMIFSVCAVTGFGGVVRSTPVFPQLVEIVLAIPGPTMISAAISTTVLAGICGSASGGLGIVTPILSPVYLRQSFSHAAIARVMAISSSALDSIPHNGTVVTVIKGFCGETHRSAYKAIFWLSVFLPAVGTALAIVLFMLFPNLP